MCWILKEKLKMSHVVARNDVLLWFREAGEKITEEEMTLVKEMRSVLLFPGAFSKSSVT